MPKASRATRHRKSTVTSVLNTDSVSTNKSEKSDAKAATSLSRGQRKRQAKRDQYLRREKLVLSSLKLKRKEEQKKRIDGLDAIKEALLETVSKATATDNESKKEPKPRNLLKSNKSRRFLAQKEASQMSLVMEHPSFKADPFATIREHLQNTLAGDKAQKEKEAKVHQKERLRKAEEKKVAKKENGAKRKRRKYNATRSKAR